MKWSRRNTESHDKLKCLGLTAHPMFSDVFFLLVHLIFAFHTFHYFSEPTFTEYAYDSLQKLFSVLVIVENFDFGYLMKLLIERKYFSFKFHFE